ncbi:MAG: divalent metal cation transporter [Gemmatimonas sp.]|nr:divalent metal cation transporter [Gemmatimonas sp.]
MEAITPDRDGIRVRSGAEPAGRVSRRVRGGPGWIVAAAFIGPGTVTVATLAGAGFGLVLLWALLFSTLATIVLQEMSARLGVVTGLGLGEAVRRRFAKPVLRAASILLIIAAIVLGNAAFEMGNLLGAALGIEAALTGQTRVWALAMAGVAAVLLWTGSYRLLERVLMSMVGVMAIVFVVTAAVVFPAPGELLRGLLVPTLPDGALLFTVALIGTTVVPYNLFLHSSTVRERFRGAEELGAARRDLVLSILVGGGVSMAILITSAGTIHQAGIDVTGAPDMARQLEPVLGAWATGFFAVGLFAAGMTSSITAPLAAAYATAGALGWQPDLRSRSFRTVWGLVLGTGALAATTGVQPVEAILFAQAANGVLLPAVALFLLLAVNDSRWMGDHRNTWRANLAGGAIFLVTLVLGGRAVLIGLGVL